MKRIAIILLFVMLLTGCGNGAIEQAGVVDSSVAMFERHVIGGDYAILVDMETKVCYLEFKHQAGYAGSGGIAIMLNADGTPKLWEE